MDSWKFCALAKLRLQEEANLVKDDMLYGKIKHQNFELSSVDNMSFDLHHSDSDTCVRMLHRGDTEGSDQASHENASRLWRTSPLLHAGINVFKDAQV